jgi:hypothetical protein
MKIFFALLLLASLARAGDTDDWDKPDTPESLAQGKYQVAHMDYSDMRASSIASFAQDDAGYYYDDHLKIPHGFAQYLKLGRLHGQYHNLTGEKLSIYQVNFANELDRLVTTKAERE